MYTSFMSHNILGTTVEIFENYSTINQRHIKARYE